MKISEVSQESCCHWRHHQLMNVNRELGFAERFAKSVKLFAHPAIGIDREKIVMGISKMGEI